MAQTPKVSGPADLRVYGIRHHGPGSARSLLAALQARPPDILLVEGPADAQQVLPWADHPDMKPPVALLVYSVKDLKQAAFFPFAEFSPEWQAIVFGLRRRLPVWLIDLPFSLTPIEEVLTKSTPGSRRDPFRDIAQLGGYSDPERWWEVHVERRPSADPEEAFATVLALMRELRADSDEHLHTLRREAFMRRQIRRAQQRGFQRIAVVCGAWHAPALAEMEAFTAAADKQLLSSLKQQKTQATWIPWSYERLALNSGYAAGVLAPAWYEALWRGEAPLEQWFARAVRLLRQEGLSASPAQAIEAVRLAQTLAALRDTPLPGIEELQEAALSVLCEGSATAYRLIEQRLVVGDVLGKVPPDASWLPLLADFDAQVRRCRLRLSTEEEDLVLDLRRAAHLLKSRLLHRLCLLEVPWGREEAVQGRKEGGFHEHWRLRWLPEYALLLAENGQWGSTIAEAAANKIGARLPSIHCLPDLAKLLEGALRADLPELMSPLVERIEAACGLDQDVLALSDAALPLVDVLRYGHARQLRLASVEQLLEHLMPRICVRFPMACGGIQHEVAVEVQRRLLSVQRAIDLWRPDVYGPLWREALYRIRARGAPLLAGLSMRLLFEQGACGENEAWTEMTFHLSPHRPPPDAAHWLEGFLSGGGLLLLYRPALWHVLNQWVVSLEPGNFEQILPLLRRTFSRFTRAEKEKIFALARRGVSSDVASPSSELDAERVALLQPLLRQLFG